MTSGSPISSLGLSAKPAAKRVADVWPDFSWDKKPVGVMGYR
jgi:hypothetical protein